MLEFPSANNKPVDKERIVSDDRALLGGCPQTSVNVTEISFVRQ